MSTFNGDLIKVLSSSNELSIRVEMKFMPALASFIMIKFISSIQVSDHCLSTAYIYFIGEVLIFIVGFRAVLAIKENVSL